MTTAALIVAAGRGVRAGTAIPKQYAQVAGRPILVRTIEIFMAHAQVDCVAVVIAVGDEDLYRQSVTLRSDKLLPPIPGDDTRQRSVLCGLRALAPHKPAKVLIHDAARPFTSAELVSACCEALQTGPAAIAAQPMPDTVKLTDEAGRIVRTLDRRTLWRAQTPQAFDFQTILSAHEAAATAGLADFTDDAAVAEWAGIPVRIVAGTEANLKITVPEDFALAEQRLGGGTLPLPDVRTGQGYDVHALGPGDHVWLCGVRIPHTQALVGHSDADAPLHALTDALLGTIADADIGEHFSNNDPRWRGAPSRLFLEDAVARVRAKGGTIGNADVTILCEAPKIAPHRQAMRALIAGVLGIDENRVSVKATTTEGLGFTGRREGIAALATTTVIFR